MKNYEYYIDFAKNSDTLKDETIFQEPDTLVVITGDKMTVSSKRKKVEEVGEVEEEVKGEEVKGNE